ncbi:UvrD-helicase domain-containing protein [Thauera sp.]|uniref:UvrD-helicase domain-containing protein n=1 Tax=Thauera sp. TaxID=1905334 RepID=UPI002B539FA8|nr:UvrD-helicase domain-containing protein [Thauera sp.]HRP24422.1 UvrD-helicase domain-containing protein [Thauera sp.]
MSAAPELDVFHCPLDGVRLVEASAGTGKTWNICGLYLRLLLERGLEVESLLVVTFTKAATAELSGRIRDRLVETLRVLDGGAPGGDPFVPRLLETVQARGLDAGQMRTRLRHALQVFDEAAIFTIHGFCQRALADTPFAAGLPYALELVEDDDALRLEVVRDFWRREIAGGALPAALAAHLLARRDNPDAWADTLGRHMARPLARVLWDEAGCAPDDAGSAAAVDAAQARLDAAWAAARALAGARGAAVERVLASLEHLNATSYRAEAVVRAGAEWAQWLAAHDVSAPLPKDHKLALLAADTLLARSKKDALKRGLAPPAHPFFDAAAELLAARAEADALLDGLRAGLLRRCIESGVQELRRRKRDERQIAFDDILWNAHQALHGGAQPWLAAALHARYPVALIDEFQDTDPLQFGIFDRIYRAEGRHGTLFLVGDPKQAIYSFRSADLFTYLMARERADARYTLAHNQRSAPALIEACNQLFGANPAVFMMAGLDYVQVGAGSRPRTPLIDDTEAGEGGAAPGDPGPPLRLWRIPRDETLAAAAEGEQAEEGDGQAGEDGAADAGGGVRLARAAALRRAARASAAEIARLIAAGAAGRIRIGERPLAPADIAVLVRSHSQGARMRQALAEVGVGSVELSQASVFHTEDAEELERVLLAIAEPGRERRVLAALATSAMGHDAAALARLAADEAALLASLEAFARWRELWLARGFGVMLRQWMSDAGVAARLLARADGERRLTNLMHLAELLQQSADQASPEVLLRSLASRRADVRGGEATQLRLESDRNLVQIVTVHRAKGLEYGIVFCPFLFDGYSRNGSEGPMRAWHDDDGELVLDYRADPADAKEIATRLRRERQAEDLRLIYVALTRAVQRCYLVVGSYATVRGKSMSHSEGGRSLLNWMAAGAGMSPAQWDAHKRSPADIDAQWRALVAAAQHEGRPVMRLDDLPSGEAEALAAQSAAAQRPRAQRPPQVGAGWRIGSFSALISGAAHELAARDHDARALAVPATDGAEAVEAEADPDLAASDDAVAETFPGTLSAADPSPPGAPDAVPHAARTVQPIPADDILRFPRGPVAGDCLHALFEAIDFCDPAGWEAAIAAALQAHPQRPPATLGERERALEAARQPQRLRRMLDDVLATPLLAPAGGASLRLDGVTAARRRVELGFHLPAPGLGAAQLNAWLAARGYRAPRLDFKDLAGYLKGYIDLVFEHEGRYWVLDWKSNHLGDTPQDYAPARLEAAMQAHGYHLQHLLYTLALHRHLQRSLPGYDYARHFGGVLYLFVRGVRPHWQLDGQPCGVFYHRAAQADLLALDRLVAAAPAASEAIEA